MNSGYSVSAVHLSKCEHWHSNLDTHQTGTSKQTLVLFNWNMNIIQTFKWAKFCSPIIGAMPTTVWWRLRKHHLLPADLCLYVQWGNSWQCFDISEALCEFSADKNISIMTILWRFLYGNGYDNVSVFGLGGIDLLLCWNATAVGYCCCCRLLLLVQSKYWNLLLPIHTIHIWCCEYLRHTVVAQIAYIITRGRSIQVELGKVEGFRGTLKACCEML